MRSQVSACSFLCMKVASTCPGNRERPCTLVRTFLTCSNAVNTRPHRPPARAPSARRAGHAMDDARASRRLRHKVRVISHACSEGRKLALHDAGTLRLRCPCSEGINRKNHRHLPSSGMTRQQTPSARTCRSVLSRSRERFPYRIVAWSS